MYIGRGEIPVKRLFEVGIMKRDEKYNYCLISTMNSIDFSELNVNWE